ncbi:PREDICTED: leucine-rich repeats and immunoglobulin-like domains protein 1 isoform X2 [Priapulus caudatus]|uniref:Leucine-rich repeats and immunoglobulin-like domains protein 1 isoform X2 n=1 Tax=Priapulus caudatus TaxID=37621 RepID=A0ABM1E7Q4_PRICU|nr:PREDICTED: leucine-rich repeats and immunoglobulin-like domains protein 1 isoform X2 [Priapulus caudatus]
MDIPIAAILNKKQPGVEILDLSANEISELIPNMLLPLNSSLVTYALSELRLSNNHLSRLAADTFAGLDALEELELWNNDIAQVEMGAWNGLESLRELHLDKNALTRIDKRVFSDSLPVSLRQLQLGCNRISEIDSQSIPKRVANLDLRHNQLTDLPNRMFFNNKILAIFDVSYNSLTTLRKEIFATQPLTIFNLKTANLFLHNNAISTIESGTFSTLPFLWNLYLNNNNLSSVTSEAFMGATSIGRLHLEHNVISRIEGQAFSQHGLLRNLYLNHNRLEQIDDGGLDGCQNMQYLQLDHNNLLSIPESALRHLPELYFVKLNNNRLTTLSPLLFAASDRTIEGLWLQNNYLKDNAWPAITRLERDRELDLSMNNLSFIPSEAFRNTEVLDTIVLAGNRIASIGEKTFSRHNYIDLSYNDLTSVLSKSWLPGLKPNIIVLKGNPLYCDCNLAWLDNISSNASDAVCASPEKYAGSPLYEIEPQQLVCPSAIVKIQDLLTTDVSIAIYWIVDQPQHAEAYRVMYYEYPEGEAYVVDRIDSEFTSYKIQYLSEATTYTCCIAVYVESPEGLAVHDEECVNIRTMASTNSCDAATRISVVSILIVTFVGYLSVISS